MCGIGIIVSNALYRSTDICGGLLCGTKQETSNGAEGEDALHSFTCTSSSTSGQFVNMFKEDTDDEMEEDDDNTQGGMASLFKQETDDEIEEDEEVNTTTACTLDPTHLKENKNVYACCLEDENKTVRDS